MYALVNGMCCGIYYGTYVLVTVLVYSIQLLPSREVNIKSCQPEGGCFPGGKHPHKGWQLDVHLTWRQ